MAIKTQKNFCGHLVSYL